jgi:hypothetical protein
MYNAVYHTTVIQFKGKSRGYSKQKLPVSMTIRSDGSAIHRQTAMQTLPRGKKNEAQRMPMVGGVDSDRGLTFLPSVVIATILDQLMTTGQRARR